MMVRLIHCLHSITAVAAIAGAVMLAGLCGAERVASAQESGQESEVAGKLRAAFEKKSFPGNGESSSDLNYRLFRAFSPEAGKKIPLVVFLHGAGERGGDNEAQLKHSVYEFASPNRQFEYPAFVIAPQCPKDGKWVDIDWSKTSGEGSFDTATSPVIDSVMRLVQTMIDSEPIDPARIYFTGLSMGGYGSWYAAARWPDKIAAAIPVCGGGDPSWANRYNGVGIWAVHGQVDQAVPVGRSREMVSAIALAGHAPEIRYTEYPGVNHDSWTQTFVRDDVFAWLFAQRR